MAHSGSSPLSPHFRRSIPPSTPDPPTLKGRLSQLIRQSDTLLTVQDNEVVVAFYPTWDRDCTVPVHPMELNNFSEHNHWSYPDCFCPLFGNSSYGNASPLSVFRCGNSSKQWSGWWVAACNSHPSRCGYWFPLGRDGDSVESMLYFSKLLQKPAADRPFHFFPPIYEDPIIPPLKVIPFQFPRILVSGTPGSALFNALGSPSLLARHAATPAARVPLLELIPEASGKGKARDEVAIEPKEEPLSDVEAVGFLVPETPDVDQKAISATSQPPSPDIFLTSRTLQSLRHRSHHKDSKNVIMGPLPQSSSSTQVLKIPKRSSAHRTSFSSAKQASGDDEANLSHARKGNFAHRITDANRERIVRLRQLGNPLSEGLRLSEILDCLWECRFCNHYFEKWVRGYHERNCTVPIIDLTGEDDSDSGDA